MFESCSEHEIKAAECSLFCLTPTGSDDEGVFLFSSAQHIAERKRETLYARTVASNWLTFTRFQPLFIEARIKVCANQNKYSVR